MKSLNILYHHRTQGRGVEAVHILSVANGLESRGHQIDMLSPPGADPRASGNDEVRDEGRGLLGYISDRLPELMFEALELFYNVPAAIRLLIRLRRNDIDLVYERYALFMFAGAAIAKLKGIPFVLEVNDSAHVSRVRRLVNRRAASWIESWIFDRSDALIVVTDSFGRILTANGADSRKIQVIQNGADDERFDPSTSGAAVRARMNLGDETIVGFVGKVVPWHGVDNLIHAAVHLREEGVRFTLLIVGATTAHDSIHELVEQAKLSSMVKFTGQIAHDRVPEHIAAMDIAVLPNTNEFGSPVKVFEYMAMGKAIVAPKCGPIDEILCDNVDALIVARGDPDGLARALRRLIDDPDLRSRLGTAAHNEFQQKYTWNANIDRVERICRKACL